MATGVIYFRPSADISAGHATIPSGSDSEYLLINEEVSDGNTTYIHLAVQGDSGAAGSATSQFLMSGDVPENSKYTITGARCYISAALGTDAYSQDYSLTATFIVRSREYSVVVNADMERDKYQLFVMGVTDIVALINEYRSQNNGNFPTIQLKLTTIGKSAGSSDTKSYTVIKVSQIYLELSYAEQTDIGVHVKKSGEWKAATQAYRKVNGAWVEITADECKEILQNSFCVPED